MPKGWKNDPIRHSLASMGIRTTPQSYLTSYTNIDIDFDILMYGDKDEIKKIGKKIITFYEENIDDWQKGEGVSFITTLGRSLRKLVERVYAGELWDVTKSEKQELEKIYVDLKKWVLIAHADRVDKIKKIMEFEKETGVLFRGNYK